MSGRPPIRADFNLFQPLLVLIEQCSVSRAADRLGMGQPAMSRILARLRDQFDDPLLVRGPRGMMLTPRAEALREPLRIWLQEGDALVRAQDEDLSCMKRTFRLASTDYGLLSVVTPTLARIDGEAKGVELSVQPLSDCSLKRLEDGQLDFVLTSLTPQGTGLASRRLFQETYLGLAHPDHPVHSATAGIEDLMQWPHISVSIGEGLGDWITDDLPYLAGRRVLISAESFSLVPYMLAGGEGVAVLPRLIAEQFARAHALKTFEVPAGPKPFDYHLVWHERASNDHGSRWLREIFSSLPKAVSGQ